MKISPGGGLHAGIKKVPNPSHLMVVITPRKKGRPFLRFLAHKTLFICPRELMFWLSWCVGFLAHTH